MLKKIIALMLIFSFFIQGQNKIICSNEFNTFSSKEKIQAITNSLLNYELWINQNYIYRLYNLNGTGYPFYLTGFSELYRGLSKHVNVSYIKKLDFVLSYLINIQNNWTWESDDGVIHPHYNSHFAKNFYDAYILTQNNTYLSAFKNTIKALDYFYDGEKVHVSWGSNFYAFTQIALGLTENLLDNYTHYSNIADNLFNYCYSFYNETSCEWFAGQSAQFPNGYDGRAAYYQFLAITWFMRFRNEIYIFSKSAFNKLINITKNSLNLIIDFILESGTFYYSTEVPDYTESASIILYGLTIIDQYFQTNNENIITSALNTIIERQRDDGAYYMTNTTDVEIFYTDNIAQFAWHFIECIKNDFSSIRVSIIIVFIPLMLFIVILNIKYVNEKSNK